MLCSDIPKLVKIRGPVRIEKLSVGYQVWNDYRFIAFFFQLWEAEACMDRIFPSANICA
ncbi:hypothetical protein SAMN05444161_8411 [Rhizobiales bacterium GAS191]|nr:hypothetical protein SAMN05444161_8411 [Rhizobiales bacterium GAS191]